MPLNKDLRELWAQAGYPSGMGSAAVVAPPPKRFRRAYHLTSAEHAISDIAFGRIKVARFTKLNDPFELLAPRFLRRSLDFEKFRREYDLSNGLLCFSADWTDPVLWSHYGQKHRGICLGFNVSKEILRDVEYVSERMTNSDLTNPAFADEILCKKFRSWDYEKESRVLIPLEDYASKEGDLHFVRFNGDIQLAEVIIGPLCSITSGRIRKVVNKLQEGVVTFKARLAHKSYNIVPMESTVFAPERAKLS